MRCTLAALALGAALGATHASAQEQAGTLKKIQESGSIALGYREDAIPFSWLGDRQQPMGYSMDLCAAVIEEVKKELALSTLAVKLTPVTAQTRLALVANGSIDLECGSTSNTLARQKQVAFSPVTFVSATRLLVKRSARVKSLRDLKGKSVAVTQGTTNERALKLLSDKQGLNIKFINAKDHAEGFMSVESGRAAAFSTDDVLLHGLVARAKNPKDFEIVGDALSYEPYGLVFRANDDTFGVVVRRAIARLFGEAGQCNGPIRSIYRKWFIERLPSGGSLNMPMSPLLESACRIAALPE